MNSIFITKEIYIQDPQYFDVNGYNMNGCNSWNVNVPQDIYGIDGYCVNCTIEIDVISTSIEEVVFESDFHFVTNQKRRFTIDPKNGEILSNEVID